MSEIHSAAILLDGTHRAIAASSARFPWWSFTKTALAICAMRLVEEGLLALDAPRPGKPYTLRQLLQHRAGVPNYGALESYHQAVARGDTPWPRDTLLEAVGADQLDFAPGTGWAYSNVGYMFVRETIEAVTGLEAGSALHRFVLAPLELSSVEWTNGASDFDDIHWPDGRNYHPGWVYHGCLKGTASDAARLLHALFRGDLLRRESLAAMLDPYPLGGALPGRPWSECGYGLGFMAGKMEEAGRAFGHSGAGPFSVNAVYHFPDRPAPITVAVFTDGCEEGRAEHVACRLALETS